MLHCFFVNIFYNLPFHHIINLHFMEGEENKILVSKYLPNSSTVKSTELRLMLTREVPRYPECVNQQSERG